MIAPEQEVQSEMDQNEINIVLEPLKERKYASHVFESGDEKNLFWIFVFHFDQSVSEYYLSFFLNDYFNTFQDINLESNIYVLIYSKMAIMYEVYRKMPGMNLTVLLLCNFNQTSDTGLGTNFDWTNFDWTNFDWTNFDLKTWKNINGSKLTSTWKRKLLLKSITICSIYNYKL